MFGLSNPTIKHKIVFFFSTSNDPTPTPHTTMNGLSPADTDRDKKKTMTSASTYERHLGFSKWLMWFPTSWVIMPVISVPWFNSVLLIVFVFLIVNQITG